MLAILLFVLLFLQDGLPLFLFADDDPELAFHMWALLGMLISLGLGWKWEGLSAALTLLFFIADEIALLTYGIRTIGLPDGFAMPLSAFSFSFISSVGHGRNLQRQNYNLEIHLQTRSSNYERK